MSSQGTLQGLPGGSSLSLIPPVGKGGCPASSSCAGIQGTECDGADGQKSWGALPAGGAGQELRRLQKDIRELHGGEAEGWLKGAFVCRGSQPLSPSCNRAEPPPPPPECPIVWLPGRLVSWAGGEGPLLCPAGLCLCSFCPSLSLPSERCHFLCRAEWGSASCNGFPVIYCRHNSKPARTMNFTGWKYQPPVLQTKHSFYLHSDL